MVMGIVYYKHVEQGSDEWHAQRRGILTASEMKLIVTPTLKPASNDKERSHLWELVAQRVTGFTEPSYVNDDMLRGLDDELYARDYYRDNYDPVDLCGFITNDEWGFTIGCSPDGLVGDDGLIEIKSRRQKFQVETIINAEVPSEYMIQIQTQLLVTRRKWCDYVSFCGGMPMATIRVYPEEDYAKAIIDASRKFYNSLEMAIESYQKRQLDGLIKLVATERREIKEII